MTGWFVDVERVTPEQSAEFAALLVERAIADLAAVRGELYSYNTHLTYQERASINSFDRAVSVPKLDRARGDLLSVRRLLERMPQEGKRQP